MTYVPVLAAAMVFLWSAFAAPLLVTSGFDQSSAVSGAEFQSKFGEICGLARFAAVSS